MLLSYEQHKHRPSIYHAKLTPQPWMQSTQKSSMAGFLSPNSSHMMTNLHMPAYKKYNNMPTISMESQPGKLYTDQTGQLPFTSNWGSTYYIIFYVYNANAIIAEPIKNCPHTELVRAYPKYYTFLQAWGCLKPSLPHKTHIYNTHHLTCMNRMLLKKQFKHGKSISLLELQTHLLISPLQQISITSQNSACAPSTCSNLTNKTPQFPLLRHFEEATISHTHPCHPQAQNATSMSNLLNALHGDTMPPKPGR